MLQRQQPCTSLGLGYGDEGTDGDGGHLNHGPLAAAILLAGVRLGVAVPLQLQLEDGMKRLVICSLCLLLSTCVTHTGLKAPMCLFL